MVMSEFFGMKEPNFSQPYLLMSVSEQNNQTTVGKLRTSTIGYCVFCFVKLSRKGEIIF